MREIWWKNLKQWSSWNHILTSLNFWDVLLNRQTKTEYLPLNRSFCCMSRNAFCKGIFDLFLLTRPLHIFSAFEKPRIVFVRFLQKYWPWLGYSFIFFRAFFFFFLERVRYHLNVQFLQKSCWSWLNTCLLGICWVTWPGYQTTNKSDFTAAEEVCLANCWWNELLVLKYL